MSFTTMNMSGPHIWGFNRDDQEMRIARSAGWKRADLVWERLMESGNQCWAENQISLAARRFRQAEFLARICFQSTDLRMAASTANLAVIAVSQGNMARAERLQKKALVIWSDAGTWIEGMSVSPRSRSSLFHLRMESLHRETFHQNLKTRFMRFAAETNETLSGLTDESVRRHRHYSRWRGERPSVYDDTRKILGACLLIADLKQD
jgi:hypothetical protein